LQRESAHGIKRPGALEKPLPYRRQCSFRLKAQVPLVPQSGIRSVRLPYGLHEEGRVTDGGDLLSRISNEIVQAQEAFFGERPIAAKSYILDDMLFVVMRGGFTAAEMTMLEFGHGDLVRQFRQIFENEMGEGLIGVVEELTGRKVLTYQSQVLFDPNIALEVFVFDDTDAKAAEANARGQVADEETGAATDEDTLDAPSDTPK
jgi:uncharacterized protein YbcI